VNLTCSECRLKITFNLQVGSSLWAGHAALVLHSIFLTGGILFWLKSSIFSFMGFIGLLLRQIYC
jgi:hypothetical protein